MSRRWLDLPNVAHNPVVQSDTSLLDADRCRGAVALNVLRHCSNYSEVVVLRTLHHDDLDRFGRSVGVLPYIAKSFDFLPSGLDAVHEAGAAKDMSKLSIRRTVLEVAYLRLLRCSFQPDSKDIKSEAKIDTISCLASRAQSGSEQLGLPAVPLLPVLPAIGASSESMRRVTAI